MRIGLIALVGSNPLTLLVSAQEGSEFSIAPLCQSLLPYSYDSGEMLRPTTSTTVVSPYPDAEWIQLDLTDTHLAPNTKLILRGATATQELDATALAFSSNGYSAMFEGDYVSVEIVHFSTPGDRRLGPVAKGAKRSGRNRDGDLGGTTASRVIVSNVLVGRCEDDPKVQQICGSSDNRAASTDKRQGRITLGGICTAWLVSKSVFVTAGHCGDATANSRISFTHQGRGVAVPPEDQYAIDLSTYRRGCSSASSCSPLEAPDWFVGRFLPNAVTGLFPGEANGAWYTISTSAPSVGSTVRVTGYGTDSSSTANLSQQTHAGRLNVITSKIYGYSVDTMVWHITTIFLCSHICKFSSQLSMFHLFPHLGTFLNTARPIRFPRHQREYAKGSGNTHQGRLRAIWGVQPWDEVYLWCHRPHQLHDIGRANVHVLLQTANIKTDIKADIKADNKANIKANIKAKIHAYHIETFGRGINMRDSVVPCWISSYPPLRV